MPLPAATAGLVEFRGIHAHFDDGSFLQVPLGFRVLEDLDGTWVVSRKKRKGGREGWRFQPGEPRCLVEAALEELTRRGR